VAVTSLTVFVTGLDIKRSIYENSLITLTILSASFFCFLTTGLYFGLKLKDTLGKMTDKIKWVNGAEGVDHSPGFHFPDIGGIEIGDVPSGDGCEGVIAGIFLWIIATVLIFIFLFFFGTILWAFMVIISAALYWVFYRAVRLVLKHGNKCKNDLYESIKMASSYTLLYTAWIYLIVFVLHEWPK
jgi:hypothetical protein